MSEISDLTGVRMGFITNGLVLYLPEHGSFTAPIKDLAVPVDNWRTAARRAGKIIGRPLRTSQDAYGGVTARLADWPRDDWEIAQQRADDRRRAEEMEAYLLGQLSQEGRDRMAALFKTLPSTFDK